MATEERPITRADYERVYALLEAYRVRDLGGGELLWEILHRIHKDDLEGRLLSPEQVAGDEGIARETNHAAIVLEALIRGKTTVRTTDRTPLGICGTPGCPEPTYGSLCPACELKASGM